MRSAARRVLATRERRFWALMAFLLAGAVVVNVWPLVWGNHGAFWRNELAGVLLASAVTWVIVTRRKR